MSEYPIGMNGEMIHCLDDSDYAQFCRHNLEESITVSEIQTLASDPANREMIIKWKGRVEVPKTEANDSQTLIDNTPTWNNK